MTLVDSPEFDEPVQDRFQLKMRMRPVDSLEDRFRCRVERRENNVRSEKVVSYFFKEHERAVGEDGHRDDGHFLHGFDHAPQSRVKRGFAGAGKGNHIDIRKGRESLPEFFDDSLCRHILHPSKGPAICRPKFAIHTVKRTGLLRYDVHTEGAAKPPGRDGSEHIAGPLQR